MQNTVNQCMLLPCSTGEPESSEKWAAVVGQKMRLAWDLPGEAIRYWRNPWGGEGSVLGTREGHII